MSEERRELGPIEEALASLRPAVGGLDRDRLMWEAGRASRRTPLVWPLATAAVALVAVALAAWPRQAPEARVVERIVYVTPAPSAPAQAVLLVAPAVLAAEPPETWQPSGPGYVALRNAVLARGIDALPEAPAGAAAKPESVRDLLRDVAG